MTFKQKLSLLALKWLNRSGLETYPCCPQCGLSTVQLFNFKREESKWQLPLYLGVEKARTFLPEGIEIFDMGGQTVFPAYDRGGFLSTSCYSYLFTKSKQHGGLGGNSYCNFGIEHLMGDTEEMVTDKIKASVPIFLKSLKEIA